MKLTTSEKVKIFRDEIEAKGYTEAFTDELLGVILELNLFDEFAVGLPVGEIGDSEDLANLYLYNIDLYNIDNYADLKEKVNELIQAAEKRGSLKVLDRLNVEAANLSYDVEGEARWGFDALWDSIKTRLWNVQHLEDGLIVPESLEHKAFPIAPHKD